MNKKELANMMLTESILNTVKFYGIEGGYEAIERVYSDMPNIKEPMLKKFKEIYSLDLDKVK